MYVISVLTSSAPPKKILISFKNVGRTGDCYRETVLIKTRSILLKVGILQLIFIFDFYQIGWFYSNLFLDHLNPFLPHTPSFSFSIIG